MENEWGIQIKFYSDQRQNIQKYITATQKIIITG